MKYILSFIVFIMSIDTFASACDDHLAIFNSHYSLAVQSNEMVELRYNHNDFKKMVKINEAFNGRPDKHIQTQYVINSIKQKEINIRFVVTRDMRSLGGEFAACEGELHVVAISLHKE